MQEEQEILYLKDWNFEKEFAEYGLYEAYKAIKKRAYRAIKKIKKKKKKTSQQITLDGDFLQ